MDTPHPSFSPPIESHEHPTEHTRPDEHKDPTGTKDPNDPHGTNDPNDPHGTKDPGKKDPNNPGSTTGGSSTSIGGPGMGTDPSGGGTKLDPPGTGTGSGSSTAPPGGPSLPVTPLTEAGNALTALAKPEAGPNGKDGGSAKVDARFQDASDTLAASWSDFKDKLLDVAKQKVEDKEASWTKDGYADAVDHLPDIEKTLEDWQALKEKNPFDSKGLSDLATLLASQAKEILDSLDKAPLMLLDAPARLSLMKGVEAVCAEVGRQAQLLNDPVKAVTADLDKLSVSLSLPSPDSVRSQLDMSLKSKLPDEVWSRAKNGLIPLIKDKALAKEVKAIFSGDLGKALSSWKDRIKPPIDAAKLISINRTLADKIGGYDRQLADLKTDQVDLKSAASVNGLRETLHAIAGRLSHDTKWVAQAGGFPAPQ